MFGGAYVFFFRGVPMLVQLLLVYYLLPFAGINVSPIVAAISAVSLCSASYIAEILRGGFSAFRRVISKPRACSGFHRSICCGAFWCRRRFA